MRAETIESEITDVAWACGGGAEPEKMRPGESRRVTSTGWGRCECALAMCQSSSRSAGMCRVCGQYVRDAYALRGRSRGGAARSLGRLAQLQWGPSRALHSCSSLSGPGAG